MGNYSGSTGGKLLWQHRVTWAAYAFVIGMLVGILIVIGSIYGTGARVVERKVHCEEPK